MKTERGREAGVSEGYLGKGFERKVRWGDGLWAGLVSNTTVLVDGPHFL